MNTQQLLNEVLPILHSVKDNREKLQQILDFLNDNIYEEPEDLQLPEKYKNVIIDIADSIDAGLVCFLNLETLEVEHVPKELVTSAEEYELITGESIDDLGLNHLSWKKYSTFEPLESHDSFEIMESFAEDISDSKFQDKLTYALNNRKPFANFKHIIDNSRYRQDWFYFKNDWLKYHVKELLHIELKEK